MRHRDVPPCSMPVFFRHSKSSVVKETKRSLKAIPARRSQAMVSAIAKRFVVSVFAAAEGEGRFRGDGEFDRGKFAAFVRTVAERLVGGFAASAPPIIAWLQLHNIGGFFRDRRFSHTGLLFGAAANAARLRRGADLKPVSFHCQALAGGV